MSDVIVCPAGREIGGWGWRWGSGAGRGAPAAGAGTSCCVAALGAGVVGSGAGAVGVGGTGGASVLCGRRGTLVRFARAATVFGLVTVFGGRRTMLGLSSPAMVFAFDERACVGVITTFDHYVYVSGRVGGVVRA